MWEKKQAGNCVLITLKLTVVSAEAMAQYNNRIGDDVKAIPI